MDTIFKSLEGISRVLLQIATNLKNLLKDGQFREVQQFQEIVWVCMIVKNEFRLLQFGNACMKFCSVLKKWSVTNRCTCCLRLYTQISLRFPSLSLLSPIHAHVFEFIKAPANFELDTEFESSISYAYFLLFNEFSRFENCGNQCSTFI